MAYDTYKAVDVVRIVNDGADLPLRTNSDWSKNIGTGTDKPINLQTTASNISSSQHTIITLTYQSDYYLGVLTLRPADQRRRRV